MWEQCELLSDPLLQHPPQIKNTEDWTEYFIQAGYISNICNCEWVYYIKSENVFKTKTLVEVILVSEIKLNSYYLALVCRCELTAIYTATQ